MGGGGCGANSSCIRSSKWRFFGLKYCEKTHIEVSQQAEEEKEEANQNYFHSTVSLREREREREREGEEW